MAGGPPADAPVVYLHVGGMKTGTSFLQSLLIENRDALTAEGVLFPGGEWGAQVRAVRDILQLALPSSSGTGAPDERLVGAWPRLRAEMLAHRGRASVVSMEFLSFATPEQARSVVDSLAPAPVEVILTVRDATRVLPAKWQEHTQNRGTLSWSQWCDGITAAPGPHNRARRSAMRAVAVPRMVRSWLPAVGVDRLHVVTVPPAGNPPRQLWQRFAEVLGLDEGGYRLPERANESLGHVSAELLRRLNLRLGDLPFRTYVRTVKYVLAKQVLARRTGEPPVLLPERLLPFAEQCNRRTVRAVHEQQIRVVGDLGDLNASSRLDPGIVTVGEHDLLCAAGDAARGVRQQLAEDDIMLSTEPADIAGSLDDALAHLVRLVIEAGCRMPEPAAPHLCSPEPSVERT